MEITLKRISLLVVIAMVAILSSCKKDSTTTGVENWPVVIGYLMPGQPISVKVYQQKGLTDTATYGALIGGLTLNISDGSKTVKLTETASGTYTYSDATFLAAGKTYSLQFTYQGAAVSASTLMPAKITGYTSSKSTVYLSLSYATGPTATDSVAIHFAWNNPNSLYHVLVFKNDDNDPFNIHPNFNSPVNFTFNAKQAAYYDVYYNSLNYIGIYRAILYSVNQEYIDALTTNANQSSQKLTNPPTNVTNGFGIFTALQADTIKLTMIKQ